MAESEEWRAIPGTGGRYSASDTGRIRADFVLVDAGRTNPTHHALARRGGICRQTPGSNGYLRVRIADGGGQGAMRSVHRLVLLAFGDGAVDGPEVNHRDGDKRNNRLGNLEWSSRTANMQHSVRVLMRPAARGERSGTAKLREADVVLIKRRLADGDTVSRLAAKYRCTLQMISAIKLGKTWRHVHG